MPSVDSYTPNSTDTAKFRQMHSYDIPEADTPLSSEYSSEMSQTSSVLGRLIEYVLLQVEVFYFVTSPIQQINDRKGDLHKVESVVIQKRYMMFSLRSFENRYMGYLAVTLRPKLIAPAIVLIAYSSYSLFASDWFRSDQYVTHWETAPNVLYNITWISFLVVGFFALYVGLNKSIFKVTVELFFQYWALYVVVVGILFGNRWRVTQICNVPYNTAFAASSDKYPEIDLVMLLVGVVIYLSVYAEMRLRRLVWVVLTSFLVYSVTAIVFGIPFPKSVESSSSTTVVELDVDRSQAWFLSVCLLLLFAVALLGKFTLELLQRRNFLELELASKRIDVLEKTINAIDDDNQPHTQLEQTHKRLKDAERIIEKVKLMGNSGGEGVQLAFAQELETALALIRKTERNMTMLDFHKEVLLGPIRTGVEWKQEEVINWIETVVNPTRTTRAGIRTGPSQGTIRGSTPSEASYRRPTTTSASYGFRSPSRRTSSSVPPGRIVSHEDELGISAKSLMKQIGFDWNLSLFDLEHTLRSNQAADLSAIRLVTRATLGVSCRELLNVSSEVVNAFASAVEDLYLDVPFHNANHAAQVCHHANVLAEHAGVRRHLSRADQAALSVAALCHDISHFGRSNAYLVETRHELAIRYNDSAVMENFHAAMTFQLIKSSGGQTDITSGMSKREERRFRSRTIQLILATDSSTHFQLVAELRMRLMGKSLFEDPQLEETDKRVVLSAIVRAADLGHHAMPLDVHTTWVEALAEEYAQQGDDERALNMAISPMCDRSSQDIPSMQIGFMNLVVMPLFDEVFNLVRAQNTLALDAFGAVCGQLVSNHAHWTVTRNQKTRIAGTSVGDFDLDDQRTIDDRMSDGSELYIPAPTGVNGYIPRSPFETEESDASSHPDLIQRVYSSEVIKRPAEASPRDSESESGSAVSLTYSQAHGEVSPANRV